MKKILLLSVFTIAIFATDNQRKEFVTTSISSENAQYLGFNPDDDFDKIEFGEEISIGQINDDSLKSYPNTHFSEQLKQKYLPVILDNRVRCFVVIDKEGIAVSLGYRKLAEEMGKISNVHSVKLENIKLYRSTQINSYLFSVPINKTRNSTPNLTILEKGWDSKRGTLSLEYNSVKYLLNRVKGDLK